MGFFSFFKKIGKHPENTLREAAWQVLISDGKLTSVNYDQQTASLLLSDIRTVIIETNDSGPWGTDVWWNISDGAKELQIPGGATGEGQMLEALQQLEGFDNEQLIAAMSCTDNAQFYCLER